MRPVFAMLLLAALTACSSEFADSDALFRVADTSGSIEVPLLGTDAAGHTYQLRGATFEVSGTAMVTLSTSPAARSLATPLPMGRYQLYLRPGYQVVEVTEKGQHPIPARLSSKNPVPFQVEPRASGRLKLAFRHGDVSIAFGISEAARRAQLPAQENPAALAVVR